MLYHYIYINIKSNLSHSGFHQQNDWKYSVMTSYIIFQGDYYTGIVAYVARFEK